MLSDLPVLSDLSPWRRLYTCLLASIQLDSAAILFSRDTRELHAICTHPTLDCSSILPYRHTSYHVLHWIVHPSYPILLQLSLSDTSYLVVHCSAILSNPTYLSVPYHTSYPRPTLDCSSIPWCTVSYILPTSYTGLFIHIGWMNNPVTPNFFVLHWIVHYRTTYYPQPN